MLFGVSFGYVEAAVVVYLRTLADPIRQKVDPAHPSGELFPLITREQMLAAAPDQSWLLRVEVAREACTLLMLAGVALAVTGDRHLWLPAFALTFGTWDLFFYVFLKILIGWPASLLTWDILFLIPVPWVGPVLAPLLVSLVMIGTGSWYLRAAERERPVRLGPGHWAGIIAGGVVIVVSFAEDYRNIMAGGLPSRFDWLLFSTGMMMALLSYGWALRPRAMASR